MALGFESYSYTPALGRKRVLVETTSKPDSSVMITPLKRTRSGSFNFFPLETLPQDILIRVLCCVDHEDLEQLLHVSKTIREATEIAKKCHFVYSTPKKKIFAFPSSFDLDNANGFEEIEPPKAPLRKSKSRMSSGKLGSISVALFTSMDEEQ